MVSLRNFITYECLTDYKLLFQSFHFIYGNVNPIRERYRDGKFPTSHSNYFPISHSWPGSCDKIKISHSRLHRSWGIYIWEVPFVICWEILIRSFATRAGIITSLNLSLMGLAQSYFIWQAFWTRKFEVKSHKCASKMSNQNLYFFHDKIVESFMQSFEIPFMSS